MFTPPAPLRTARRATSVIFLVHGAVTGTFAARLPWIAGHVGVGPGGLGLALLMPGLGAILAMPFAGRLVHRYDQRRLTRVLMIIWCLALVPPGLAPSLPPLCAALAVYGATAGLADVAMNAQAVKVEEGYRRSVMSSFHGFWSAGGLIGSALAALAARVGLDARLNFAATALLLIGTVLVTTPGLLSFPPAAGLAEPPAFALPSRPVLWLGLIGLCAVFAEGASLDWSAVFVRSRLGASAGVAALAVTAFSLSMAATRLVGDLVVRRIGPVGTVRLAGVCATVGAAAVVLSGTVPVALLGFALIGAGVATVVPLVFAAAGTRGPHPARSIAGVAGIAYGSGLIAPGVIGGIGQASSLAVSFTVVAGLTAVMGLGAGVLRPRPRPAPSATGSQQPALDPAAADPAGPA